VGKFFGFREVSAESDGDALAAAQPLLAEAPSVKIWERARRVGSLFSTATKVAR